MVLRNITPLILAALAVLLTPTGVQAADHRESPVLVLDTGRDELVRLNLAIYRSGDAEIPGDSVVGMDLRFSDVNGVEIGKASQEVAVRGFGTFSVKHRKAGNGTTQGVAEQFLLFVNDQLVGFVSPDQYGRVLLRVDVRVARMGRNPRTGEFIQIPASPVIRGFAITIDELTGQTLATKSLGSMIAKSSEPD